MLPETITMLPNSPHARANDSSAPAAMAGRIAGSTTLRKVVQPLAPSVRRGLLLGGIELQQHGLHGAQHERQGDDQQRQLDAERREDRP